jgi:hypothetical protein
MRFAGIDIGSERHFVAVVDENGTVLHASGMRTAQFRVHQCVSLGALQIRPAAR